MFLGALFQMNFLLAEFFETEIHARIKKLPFATALGHFFGALKCRPKLWATPLNSEHLSSFGHSFSRMNSRLNDFRQSIPKVIEDSGMRRVNETVVAW